MSQIKFWGNRKMIKKQLRNKFISIRVSEAELAVVAKLYAAGIDFRDMVRRMISVAESLRGADENS